MAIRIVVGVNWGDEEIGHIRDFEKLPGASQNYVVMIEKLVGIPIRYISVGPEREALIIR